MSQNGAIKSLQKFRYTKRIPGDHDESDSNSGSEVKTAEQGDDPDFVQSTSASSSSPESDGRLQTYISEKSGLYMYCGPATTVSPVFNKKFGCQSSVKSSSQTSSPWLSKSHGTAQAVTTNGTTMSKSRSRTKPKYRRVRTYSSSDSEVDAGRGPTADSHSPTLAREAVEGGGRGEWSGHLAGIFPSATPLQLRAALAAAIRAHSLKAGIDYLVKGHSKGKRKHCDSEDTVQLPKLKSRSFKRIRTMSGDSDDSSPPSPSPPSPLPPSPSPPRVAGSSQGGQEVDGGDSEAPADPPSPLASEDSSVQFLQAAFPMLHSQRVRQVLGDCGGSTDQAAIVLSSDLHDHEAERQTERQTEGRVERQTERGGERQTEKRGERLTGERGAASSTVHATRSSSTVTHDVLTVSDGDDDYAEEGDDSEDSLVGEDGGGRRGAVLAFLEEASLPEMLLLPGCSRKKAEALIDLRPFQTWEQLMQKLDSSRNLSSSLVHGCQEIIALRSAVQQLLQQCQDISGQMERVVSRLTGSAQGDGEDEDHLTCQPALMNAQLELKPYQLIGLNWLRIMHTQHLNGILADEMGLGKTVQAIAFLAHLLEEGEEGPHVIIVPSSTIDNWLRELCSWCPALGVVVYYGSQEERRATRHSVMDHQREDFQVLLTTYNIATGSAEDRSLFKKFQFHYAVFDEGHMLKNMASRRFQHLMKISAERRLLLTGTPLQNNLVELMSLLCFVMPDIFQGQTQSLHKMFSLISRVDNEQGKYEKERIAQAQRIMRPFVLRRLKKDVLTDLPRKEEEVRVCGMVGVQRRLYSGLLQQLSGQQQQGGGGGQGGGMAMFMQLRKAANHPLLLRHHYDDHTLSRMARALATELSHRERGALPELIMEDMSVMNDFDLTRLCQQYKRQLGQFELAGSWIGESGKLQVLESVLHTAQQQGDRVLLFSQFTMMLDIVEVFLTQRTIRFLRLDGSTPVTDRQCLIDQYNRDGDILVFLLSTRAGGLGINLTSANTILLHDIDFNPYNDKQAEDRCHRLGQTRTVRVVRLIAGGTVEEGMLRCARAKLRLEQDVTTAEDSQEMQSDVAMLLREALSKATTSDRPETDSPPPPPQTPPPPPPPATAL